MLEINMIYGFYEFDKSEIIFNYKEIYIFEY